ncbi:MAG TPA: PadR family transcriptional regulator [Solirubrobacterales bacterium]|jgi:DNA-binding PadR family transcriptional regulator|nr:PadR family transcriptional regulator [Solirubrobacterales bacterium]
MKLRPASHLILGMVRLGAGSGYAIKKAADVSTRFFWPMSLAQVYPELGRLEQAGLLSRTEDSAGGRERFAYELTAEGEEALLTWMRSPREGETQFRDEGILRLFFADGLPREDQLALVRRLRERARDGRDRTREEIIPLADALESNGLHFPARVARLRAETYASTEHWLAELEAELEV